MKIIIEIPDQFYKAYAKYVKHPDVDLPVMAKMAAYKELRTYAAVYAKDIEVTCELPKE